MKLRVGMVARCLNTAHIRGMGRYAYELLRHSDCDSGPSWRLYGDDPRYPMLRPPDIDAEVDVFEFRGDRFNLWEQLGLPLRARRDSPDLLHCTEGSLPWWQPVPTVVTLHDTLAWEEEPSTNFYLDSVLPAALSRCAAVITISESSRRDIAAKWPHLASKLTAIPHGIADEYFIDGVGGPTPALRTRLGDAPYLVYIGGPLPRKRLGWALQVLAASTGSELHLVVCGFDATKHVDAHQLVPNELRARVHFAPFLSDSELLALYRGAQAVLYPTLYEGFGFPAVEAQAAGTPVIFSALGSLAELIGPLSFVAEPNDLSAWTDALSQAVSIGDRRPALAGDAREWARAFSWQRSFDAHLAVYRSVLSPSRA
jgi:glycosyltransferase involved in cell wall biosynthesis